MKKDLSPHSISPFDKLEDTKNHPNRQSQAIKHLQKLADEDAQNRNLPTSTYNMNNLTALTNCVVDFLSLSGHQPRLVSLSPQIKVYQRTIYEDIPNDVIVATWIPIPKLNGVHAEVVISQYGEKAIVEVLFDFKNQLDAENGKYHLEIRSFEEFLQWYNLTFGEGAL